MRPSVCESNPPNDPARTSLQKQEAKQCLHGAAMSSTCSPSELLCGASTRAAFSVCAATVVSEGGKARVTRPSTLLFVGLASPALGDCPPRSSFSLPTHWSISQDLSGPKQRAGSSHALASRMSVSEAITQRTCNSKIGGLISSGRAAWFGRSCWWRLPSQADTFLARE